MPGATSSPKRKPYDVGAIVELVQPGLVAADRAAEHLGEALTVAQVVAVGEQDSLGPSVAGDRVDTVLGHARIDQRRRRDVEMRVHRAPDALVEGRPMQHARKDLVHRNLNPLVGSGVRYRRAPAALLAPARP